MKDTAVEFLINQLGIKKDGWNNDVLKKAKAMEKEQIIDTFQDSRILSITNNCSSGEQYYNETFKSE